MSNNFCIKALEVFSLISTSATSARLAIIRKGAVKEDGNGAAAQKRKG
jgi:hypothetical protein